MDDGVSRVLRFLRAEEKQGFLSNLWLPQGHPINFPERKVWQQYPACGYRISSKKYRYHIYLSTTLQLSPNLVWG